MTHVYANFPILFVRTRVSELLFTPSYATHESDSLIFVTMLLTPNHVTHESNLFIIFVILIHLHLQHDSFISVFNNCVCKRARNHTAAHTI